MVTTDISVLIDEQVRLPPAGGVLPSPVKHNLVPLRGKAVLRADQWLNDSTKFLKRSCLASLVRRIPFWQEWNYLPIRLHIPSVLVLAVTGFLNLPSDHRVCLGLLLQPLPRAPGSIEEGFCQMSKEIFQRPLLYQGAGRFHAEVLCIAAVDHLYPSLSAVQHFSS